MRNACLGATFKGNVIETRCAASQTGTVIILDLLPRSREVLRIFQCYSKTFIGDVFFELCQRVGGSVWHAAQNTLFRITVQKTDRRPKRASQTLGFMGLQAQSRPRGRKFQPALQL